MWSSSGPNVYNEDGEWVADCRVPSIYSQAQVEALAKQIAEDHNTVAQLVKLLGEARKYVLGAIDYRETQHKLLTDIDAALSAVSGLAEKEVGE